MTDPIRIDRLTLQQFAMMLRHGRGLALMHVLEYGLDEVAHLVLQACLVNQAYDPQCEPERSEWLYRMFKGSAQRDSFSDAILTAMPLTSHCHDIAQLCRLAALMALDGDLIAATTLRNFVLGQNFSDGLEQFGCDALVMLDGLPALVELGRRFGAMLMSDPAASIEQPDTLMNDFDERAADLAVLEQLALQDAALRMYLSHYQRERLGRHAGSDADLRNTRREQIRRNSPITSVLKAAQSDTRPARYFFRAFGMYATQEELDLVLKRLVSATEPETCLRLLWIFSSATMPRIEPRVLALAENPDREIRDAAHQALSWLPDPAVGRLARGKLQESHLSADDSSVVTLLRKQLSPGDDELILARLQSLSLSDFEMHRFSCEVVDICAEGDRGAAATLSTWVYETTPCSVCRKQSVDRLLELGRVDAGVANECAFDANPKIVALSTQAV